MRLLLAAICFSVLIGYDRFAIRAYRAYRWSEDSSLSSIEHAIDLEPANADYHDLLCRDQLFLAQKPEQAAEECRSSTELNPYSSTILLDLAQTYYAGGDTSRMDRAIQQAFHIDPTTPNTAWAAANFMLAEGRVNEALQLFAIVLREDSTLAPSVLNNCWHSLHDAHQIKNILPPHPAIYLDFIKLLLAEAEFSQARYIWEKLMRLNTAVDYRQGLYYIDCLLQAGDVQSAIDAWKQLQAKDQQLQAYSNPNNLVTDASLSHDILNGGFDWRYAPQSQISVSLDSSNVHTVGRSLKLQFSECGSNSGIYQYIPVKANLRYKLTAWVKSENLESANGPVIALFDYNDHSISSTTEETLGTTQWHRIETTLNAGPGTNLIILMILRDPEDTQIHGTLWISDITVEAL